MKDMLNKKNIIEIGDLIRFKYRMKPFEGDVIKYDEIYELTIGDNNFIDGLDNSILGKSIENKIVEINNFLMPQSDSPFSNQLVTIGLKIIEHIKKDDDYVSINSDESEHNFIDINNEININKETEINKEEDKEKFDTNLNTINNDYSINENTLDIEKKSRKKHEKKLLNTIKSLEEEKKYLLNKIEKLENELNKNLIDFKNKQQEIINKAQNEVSKIKDEIKSKAKEEINENKKYVLQKFIEDLSTPLNNLYISVEFGSNQQNEVVSGYVKGFQLLVNQIFSSLENNGIVIINPQIGEEFNPEFHQAQELVDSENLLTNQIVKIISRGYKLNDRVIKPAIVLVSK